jgi:hypothetical protein
MKSHESERDVPSRLQALMFQAKTRVFQVRRALAEIGHRPAIHRMAEELRDAPVIAEKRAPLWREVSAEEFPLTAGKVENLRVAARAFHGVEIAPRKVMSFWRQLGRTTKRRGFHPGRELREGCIVPAVGGGLCQLSGLLYQAALEAGLEVVERHRHSRIVAGSQAEQDLDATVFWNYVDLRFRSALPWRMEVELTTAELVVRIRSLSSEKRVAPVLVTPNPLPRALPSGDCLTCGMVECFRHPSAVKAHAPAMGHSAFLLDAKWPEFDRWCAEHARPGDRWFTPMDGEKWRKPNYQWNVPQGAVARHATFAALRRSWRMRRLPTQGAMRQRVLLLGDAALAKAYAEQLNPQCRHVVVSQNLLPHLWRMGVLGGRTFDVLIERWPMQALQERLDEAKRVHPQSMTLGDFRVDATLLRAENEALAAAGRLITPHRAMAEHFGSRAWLIPWEMPEPIQRVENIGKPILFFPASRLGRKGVFELAAAMKSGIDAELRYLGAADEGIDGMWDGVALSRGTLADLASATALVLPAWVEHQPRLALLALASGIPVIATQGCGLPAHENLHLLPKPDAEALAMVIRAVLGAGDSQVFKKSGIAATSHRWTKLRHVAVM